MAQEDYVISDQTGVSFLADLNSTLAAIVSNNSGATEPTTTYAYMWWPDTTSGIMKQRNAGDTAWVSMYTLSTGAVITIPDDIVTLPKVADSAIANLKAGRKNIIINGNPLANQRAYVSTTVTVGANEYTLDRWRVVTSGQALTFSTTANAVTMTLPVGGIEQVIEGLNISSGTYTVSFVATGDTVCAVDGVIKATGGTFTLTGGTNATIKLSSAGGAGTVKLIQVELGSVATDFEHRSYGEELALCQRYYQTYARLDGFLTSSSDTVRRNYTPRTVTMRATPTESAASFTGGGTSGFFGSATNIGCDSDGATAASATQFTNYKADAEL